MGIPKQSAGLTENQKKELIRLEAKESLTEKQTETLADIIKKRDFKPDFDLTVGAKTYIRGLVKEIVYNYSPEISSKEMEKGIDVEDESIELYNEVFFTNYVKNTKPNENEWIVTRECDINAPDKIIDIKSSWSKKTFPSLPDEGENPDYEAQLRGYMWLYGKDKAELAYCLVNTPEYLIEWETNKSIHEVDEIAPELRVTVIEFERDEQYEELIKYKVGEARKYAVWYEKQIINKNQ
jgi:hypothetical protein